MTSKRRQRILVVDDEPLVRDAMGEYLADAGYQAVLTTSWDVGEENFDKIDYSLVVMDIFMPGRNGLDAIHEIRQKWPMVKILAISGGRGGVTAETAVKASRKLGAHASMEKPFHFRAFITKVKELIGEPFPDAA